MSVQPIPRVRVIDVWSKPDQTTALRCFSDLHLDEDLCDHDEMRRVAERDREVFGQTRAVVIGDVANLVLPVDAKRYRASVQPAALRGTDDWLDRTIDFNAEHLKSLGYTWDVIALGNHEEAARKFHGVDVCQHLANRVGALRGGYSGVIDYRIHVTSDGEPREHETLNSKAPWVLFRVAYHHGKGGGRKDKGFSSAFDFGSQFESIHAFLYGHNHSITVDPETRLEVRGDDLVERTVYFCNCGGWVQSYSKDARQVNYSEQAMHMRRPRKSPLITLTPFYAWDGKHSRLKLDYQVTV